MKKLLLVLSCLAPITVFAGPAVSEGPGPVATYATCQGQLKDGTAVTFEVRATAIFGVTDAVLVASESNDLIDQFLCAKGGDIVEGRPSAGSVLWACKEYKKTPRMGISVELQRGGFSGLTTGQIRQEQMFPAKAKVIGSLYCK